MDRKDVLETASSLISGERQEAYGDATVNFQRVADMWAGYLGCSVSIHDVAALMILLKLSRTYENHKKADSWVDVAGYAALGAEVAGAK